MRLELAPPPSREVLAARTLHEMVRDYPETLALVRKRGIDPSLAGRRTVEESVDDSEAFVDRIADLLGWRAKDVGGDAGA